MGQKRADFSSRQPLAKEVLTPGREQTGVAVLLVAASALAFALAGSAFALWARSAHHCPHAHVPTSAAIDADLSESTPGGAAMVITGECGPEFERQGDNVDVVFRTCPDKDIAIQPANKVVIEEQEGVMVLRIVD